MARATRANPPQGRADVPEEIAELAAANSAAIAGFTQAFQAYFAGMLRFNGEMAEFVNTRVRHDMEVGQALAGCRDWTEAARLQQQWLREATEEYMAETKKLVELTTKMATEGMTPISEQASKILQQAAPGKSKDTRAP